MAVDPPAGLFQPTSRQFRWLMLQAIDRIEERIGAIMATLQELQAQVTTLQAAEAAQSGQLVALTQAVDSLIGLVGTLRVDLSTEQQAVVDATMTEVAATLAGTAAQSAELTSLAARAAAAAESPAA